MTDYYTLGLGVSVFAFMYLITNREKIKNITKSISWYSVSYYHRFNIFWKDYWKVDEVETLEDDDENYENDENDEEDEDDEEFEEEEPEKEFILLDGLTVGGDVGGVIKLYVDDEFARNDYDILFLKCKKNDKFYYKRVTDDLNLQDPLWNDDFLVVCPRQFLQVEFIMNNEKIDIHEHISKYYVEGNQLFDKNFLKYYMKLWYNVDIDDNDYKINIIDKDITLLSVEKDSWLELTDVGYNYMQKN